MEAVREEIEKIAQSAEKLKMLGETNPSLRRNAEILLNFVYVLKFITPDTGKEEI